MKMSPWCIIKKGYAQTSSKRMHRIVMNCNGNDTDNYVDHIDNNTQNNQKRNLRILHKNDPLHAYNRKNRSNTSRYRGVRKDKRKWQMYITHLGKRTTKLFDTEEEAAKFYDQKAKEFYGANANLNFPKNKNILQKRTFDQIDDAIETSNKRFKNAYSAQVSGLDVGSFACGLFEYVCFWYAIRGSQSRP